MKPFTWPSSVDLAQMIACVAMVPLPIHRLAPFSTHSSPFSPGVRVAVVRRPRALSEPLSGSVSAKHPSSSPRENFGSHSAFCSSEPATWMAPITRPCCMPTRVAMLESTRASS